MQNQSNPILPSFTRMSGMMHKSFIVLLLSLSASLLSATPSIPAGASPELARNTEWALENNYPEAAHILATAILEHDSQNPYYHGLYAQAENAKMGRRLEGSSLRIALLTSAMELSMNGHYHSALAIFHKLKAIAPENVQVNDLIDSLNTKIQTPPTHSFAQTQTPTTPSRTFVPKANPQPTTANSSILQYSNTQKPAPLAPPPPQISTQPPLTTPPSYAPPPLPVPTTQPQPTPAPSPKVALATQPRTMPTPRMYTPPAQPLAHAPPPVPTSAPAPAPIRKYSPPTPSAPTPSYSLPSTATAPPARTQARPSYTAPTSARRTPRTSDGEILVYPIRKQNEPQPDPYLMSLSDASPAPAPASPSNNYNHSFSQGASQAPAATPAPTPQYTPSPAPAPQSYNQAPAPTPYATPAQQSTPSGLPSMLPQYPDSNRASLPKPKASSPYLNQIAEPARMPQYNATPSLRNSVASGTGTNPVNRPTPQTKAVNPQLIEEWRDRLAIDYVIESGNSRSAVKIGSQLHPIGSIVIPEYGVRLHSVNAATNTLIFEDPQGGLYKKNYSDAVAR